MNPREMYVSHHWSKDRKNREDQINSVLNNDWGMGICKAWDEVHQNWQYITNTGLLVVLDKEEAFIATMFIPSPSQFFRVFKRAGQTPPTRLKNRMFNNYYLARDWEEKNLKKVA
jgi:hypothetical protein